MLKRILSFSFIAVIIFLTACTSKEDPQMALTKKLEKLTNGEILKTYYDDFNNDGKKEMFAIVGELSDNNQFDIDIADGQVWFASENMTKRVDDGNHGIGIVIVGDNAPTTVEYDNGSLFMFKSIWGNGDKKTTVCTAAAEDISVTTIPGSLVNDENGWNTLTSTYDISIKKDDFDKGKYYGSGRSWKKYWYYFDKADAKFKEYGAKEITTDQFANFDGAYDILSGIDGEIYNILYRENGIININVLSEPHGVEYEYDCSNILVGYDDGRVWVIDNQHFGMTEDYHNPVYEGFYLPALTPKLAEYPSSESLAVMPTEKLISIPPEKYDCVYFPEADAYIALGSMGEGISSFLENCRVGGPAKAKTAIRIYDEGITIMYDKSNGTISSIHFGLFGDNYEKTYKKKYRFLNNISLATTEDEFKKLYPKATMERRDEYSNKYTLYFVKDRNTGRYEIDYSANAKNYADLNFYCETYKGEIRGLGIS